jgi:hypothetical protein
VKTPLLAFLAFFSAAGATFGSTPVLDTSGCAAGDHPICVALRIEDSEPRQAAVRQAIRNTLLSADSESRDKAWRILSESVWSVDLYPYLNLIESFAPLAQRYQNVAELADHIEVLSGPRSARIELLAPAIVSGSGRLPRGTSLQRTTAMVFAARQGLVELLPAVTEYFAAHEPERMRARRLVAVPELFELCAGAATRFDAPAVAFRRILAMDERTLENRFADDEGFREAVFSLADVRCSRFGPDHIPESCSLLHEIVTRQLEYRGIPASNVTIPGYSTDWVARLQEMISPY